MNRRRRPPKAVCKRGHVLSEVGLNSEGKCKPCGKYLRIRAWHKWNQLNVGESARRQAAARAKDPDRFTEYIRKYKQNNPKYWIRKLGCTYDRYVNALNEQQGRCAICGRPDKLVCDHDHATGLSRQLLCGLCNRLLGQAKDDPHVLQAAAAYLIKHSAADETLKKEN